MAPVIRISDELYNKLAQLAVGFDTPANVIEGLLEKNGSPPEPSPPPAAPVLVQAARGGRRITKEMTLLVIKLGDKVFAGTMGTQDAKEELVAIGMNPASAAMYLTAYAAMLTGRVFKRGMKPADSRRMFDHIYKKYGIERVRLAIKAYGLHLGELEKDGYDVGTKRSFLVEIKSLYR